MPEYVKNQQYDQARTNIRYCLNQLQLGKRVDDVIQKSIDYTDDPELLESIQEAAGRITNTAIQLDSTVYTLVFIPSEEGDIPESAKKYQKQTADFYRTLDTDLELMTRAATSEQIEAAKSESATAIKSLPAFLFKPASAKPKITM